MIGQNVKSIDTNNKENSGFLSLYIVKLLMLVFLSCYEFGRGR